MELLKKYRHMIIVVVLIVAAAFVYQTFLRDKVDTSLLTSESASALPPEVGQDLLQILQTLRGLQIDESIFSDPVFHSLEDIGQELVPEPIGRPNPFAPIGTE